VDDVAPVPARVWAAVVGLEPVRLGEPNWVEPWQGLSFAIRRRGEQAIDDPLEGPGGLVGQEGTEVGDGRREPGQVEGYSTQKCGPIRGREFGRAHVLNSSH